MILFSFFQNQGRIHAYFQPEAFVQASKIKSDRMKKALDMMRMSKNQEDGDNNHQDKNVDIETKRMRMVQQSKKQNRNIAETNANNKKKDERKNSQVEPLVKTSQDAQALNSESEQNLAKSKSAKKSKAGEKILTEDKTIVSHGQTKKSHIGHCTEVKEKDTRDDLFMETMISKVKVANELICARKVGEAACQKASVSVKAFDSKGNREEAGSPDSEKKSRKSRQSTKEINRLQKMAMLPQGSKTIISLDKKTKAKRSNLKKGVAKNFTGAVNLSESSSSSDDDQDSTCVKSNKTVSKTREDSLPILNLSKDKLKNVSDSNETMPGSELEDKKSSSPKANSSLKKQIACTDDMNKKDEQSVIEEVDIRKADVSLINKEYLPSTLSYLNKRSHNEKSLLNKLQGKRSKNLVEHRLEVEATRPSLETILPKKKKTMPMPGNEKVQSFVANNAITKNIMSFDEMITGLDEKSSNKQPNKVRMNKSIDKISQKTETCGKHECDRIVNFTDRDVKINEIDDTKNRPNEDNNTVERKKRWEEARQLKSSRSQAFDQPILDYDESFGKKIKTKSSKFRKQTEHLHDNQSIKGHGRFPSQKTSSQPRGLAFAGKGKGRGKNTNKSLTFIPQEPHINASSNVSVDEIMQFADIEDVDLGSDFSDND